MVLFVLLSDENLDIINRENVVAVLLESLETHQSNAKVVKNTCMALAAMVEPDGKSIQQFSRYCSNSACTFWLPRDLVVI